MRKTKRSRRSRPPSCPTTCCSTGSANTWETRQTPPEVLAELREDVVGALILASERGEISEDVRPVATEDEGSGSRQVARIEPLADLRLEGFHRYFLPCETFHDRPVSSGPVGGESGVDEVSHRQVTVIVTLPAVQVAA